MVVNQFRPGYAIYIIVMLTVFFTIIFITTSIGFFFTFLAIFPPAVYMTSNKSALNNSALFKTTIYVCNLLIQEPRPLQH